MLSLLLTATVTTLIYMQLNPGIRCQAVRSSGIADVYETVQLPAIDDEVSHFNVRIPDMITITSHCVSVENIYCQLTLRYVNWKILFYFEQQQLFHKSLMTTDCTNHGIETQLFRYIIYSQVMGNENGSLT